MARVQKRSKANDRDSSVTQVGEDPPKPDFSRAIYDAIAATFATKNPTQMMCLCWPGTVLDYEHLKWEPSEAASGIMPERALLRSSLILDQYVPPAPITQPDGSRVSDRYRQAIRQLGGVPDENLLRLQAIIRKRLAVDVAVTINGEPKTMKLLDWFSYLNMEWVRAKQAWGNKQTEMMDLYRNQDPLDWWNKYIIWYENNADAYISRIDSAYQRLLSEFPLNAWEDAIAILDTSDNAGLLEAKQILRNATVPVPRQEGLNFTPTMGVPYSWPLELKPSTKFLDRLSDPNTQQQALETAIDQLEQDILAWMAIIPQVDDDVIEQSAKKMQEAQRGFAEAQDKLIVQYTKNAVTAVQIVCDYMASRGTPVQKITKPEEQAKVTDQAENLNKSLSKQSGTTPSSVDWAKVKEIAEKVGEGQESLIGKQGALIQAGMDLAAAADKFLQNQANRTKFGWMPAYVKQLEAKLNKLRQDQANMGSASNMYYKYLLAAGDAAPGENPNDSNKFATDAFPSPLNYPENARWSEVTVTLTKSQVSASSSLNTYFSSMQWGLSLFLGSAGGSSTQSGSEFAEEFMDASDEIQLAFLATKVLIERPWMKPEVFAATKNFFRTMKKPLAPNIQVTQEQMWNDESFMLNVINNFSFPCYPVAVLLVKDLCVKFKVKAAKTARLREMSDSVKSQGGGFFCFSVSKSESSHSESESMNSYSMAGQFVMRAPAPQILAYWVQFLPPDQSRELDAATADEISASLGFLNSLNAAHNSAPVVKSRPTPPPGVRA